MLYLTINLGLTVITLISCPLVVSARHPSPYAHSIRPAGRVSEERANPPKGPPFGRIVLQLLTLRSYVKSC